MQFGNEITYKGAPVHVIPDESKRGYFKTNCGKTLTETIDVIPCPRPADQVNIVVCDNCWVELDPDCWKSLRAAGCRPRMEEMKEKLDKRINDQLAKEQT